MCREALLANILHPRARRAAVAPAHELFDRRRGAFDNHFDAAIGAIANPAEQAKKTRLLAGGTAKPNPLDASQDGQALTDDLPIGWDQPLGVTSVACGPLSLSAISNSTSCPSVRVL